MPSGLSPRHPRPSGRGGDGLLRAVGEFPVLSAGP